MRNHTFSEEQIISILQSAEQGMPVKKIIRQYGIAEGTFLPLEE